MTDIVPMLPKDIPYERALSLPPCLELDMYMFANIMDGPEEMLRPDNLGRLPALSRKYGSSQMALLMAMHEQGQLTLDVSPNYFDEAKAKGFIVRKTQCVVWKVVSRTAVGYGRSFEEALCKLLIVAKYGNN